MTLVENKYFHGALDSKKDLRDHKWAKLGMASLPFDWNKGFDIEETLRANLGNPTFNTPTKNQGQSYSCGGQAGAYVEQTLSALGLFKFDEKSAKYIYSQIAYPGGGTTLRDVMNLIIKKGVAPEQLLPSYMDGMPPTEAFMTDNSGITVAINTQASQSKGLNYAFVGTTIDSVAQALRENFNCIIQISGSNNGTWESDYPKPPTAKEWSHFLSVGKAKLINGKKFISVHNSWGNVGDGGWQWLGEDYFTSGNVTSAGTIYQPANLQPSSTPTTTQSSWKSQLIEFLQKLINLINGPTKIPI